MLPIFRNCHTSKTCFQPASRGYPCIGFVCDEIGHYSSTGVKADVDIFNSIKKAYNYRSILALLQLEVEMQAEQKTGKYVLPQNIKTYKFTRPIEEYQQLLIPGGEDEHRDSEQSI